VFSSALSQASELEQFLFSGLSAGSLLQAPRSVPEVVVAGAAEKDDDSDLDLDDLLDRVSPAGLVSLLLQNPSGSSSSLYPSARGCTILIRKVEYFEQSRTWNH
jgi:hypothetical protein